jgi:UDP-glucose 4-epimerase
MEIAAIGRRFGRVHVMFGPLSRLPLTHVQNCADFVAAALSAPEAIGEAFNVVDSDDVRVWHYFRDYAARKGQRLLLVPLPYHFGFGIASMARWISQTLFGPAGRLPSLLQPRRYEAQFKPVRFSNAKAREKLAWTPRLAFHEALTASYRTK